MKKLIIVGIIAAASFNANAYSTCEGKVITLKEDAFPVFTYQKDMEIIDNKLIRCGMNKDSKCKSAINKMNEIARGNKLAYNKPDILELKKGMRIKLLYENFNCSFFEVMNNPRKGMTYWIPNKYVNFALCGKGYN